MSSSHRCSILQVRFQLPEGHIDRDPERATPYRKRKFRGSLLGAAVYGAPQQQQQSHVDRHINQLHTWQGHAVQPPPLGGSSLQLSVVSYSQGSSSPCQPGASSKVRLW